MSRKRRRSTVSVDHEVMPPRFVADRTVDHTHQLRIIARSTHHGFEIDRILLPETGVENAGRGDPYPVAIFAEIMRERRNETDHAARLGDASISGRASRTEREIAQRPAGLYQLAQSIERKVLVDTIHADVA